MRIAVGFLVFLSLAACNRADRSKEALRQGVMEHLASSSLGLNMSGMDVAINEMHVTGDEADVTASITPKGSPPGGNGMAIQYHLQQRNSKWVVTGRKDTGANPHGGGAAMPGAENPHGGAMPGGENPHGGAMPGAAPSSMPSPDSLPPTKKK